MNEVALIEQKELRDEVIERIEVLDRVKELLLIPQLEMVTTVQVAEYYEVTPDVIRMCYNKNKDELDLDGISRISKEILNEKSFRLIGRVGGHIIENTDVFIPARGTLTFSKRAVLRIGMLLRDSEIAKEVRTQLLNAIGKVDAQILTADIDEEKQLALNIATAMMSGSVEEFGMATKKMLMFKDRHIAELQQNNKALASGNLEWEERASVNKAVRIIAGKCGGNPAFIWKQLYDELLYKHHMNLALRGKPPLIKHVREGEWKLVQKSLAAICEEKGLSFTKIVEKAKLKND